MGVGVDTPVTRAYLVSHATVTLEMDMGEEWGTFRQSKDIKNKPWQLYIPHDVWLKLDKPSSVVLTVAAEPEGWPEAAQDPPSEPPGRGPVPRA